MFTDIYTTTPCTAYPMQEVQAGLHAAAINGSLTFHEDVPVNQPQALVGKNLNGVRLLMPSDTTTKQFGHPVILERAGVTPPRVVVVDVRPYTRIDKGTGRLVVTSATDYEFIVLRACLQVQWIYGNEREMMNASPFPAKIFSRWISENLARRLNLSPLDQLNLAVLAGTYYYCLFQKSFTQDDKNRIGAQAARAAGTDAARAIALIEPIHSMSSIRELVAGIKEIIPGPRGDSVTEALLYGTLGGSWFGPDNREVVAISLEHPPTFLAMVYEALTNRSFHKSFLAQLIRASDRQNIGHGFVHAINNILSSPYP